MDDTMGLVSALSELVNEISLLPECGNACKKMHNNLARRIDLLTPMFEELTEDNNELSQEASEGFELLRAALNSALECLRTANNGSKVYKSLHRDSIAAEFHQTTEQIEAALSKIPYNKLGLSKDVQEQIQLVHDLFKGAIERPGSPDAQLNQDLAVAQREGDPDPAILKRLSENLQLETIEDLEKESISVQELVTSSQGDPEGFTGKVSSLFKKLKDFVHAQNPEKKHRFPVIPDYFLCPMSLELMKDPVIVSTGQTYDRSSIQKWLNAGCTTCPRTGGDLNTTLTPNYVLKEMIALWCKENGVEA